MKRKRGFFFFHENRHAFMSHTWESFQETGCSTEYSQLTCSLAIRAISFEISASNQNILKVDSPVNSQKARFQPLNKVM